MKSTAISATEEVDRSRAVVNEVSDEVWMFQGTRQLQATMIVCVEDHASNRQGSFQALAARYEGVEGRKGLGSRFAALAAGTHIRILYASASLITPHSVGRPIAIAIQLYKELA